MDPTWADLDALRASRGRSGLTLTAAIAEFRAFKLSEKGKETKHLLLTISDLQRLASHLGPSSRLQAITAAQLTAWLSELDIGPKRRKDYRAAAVGLWRWAAKQDMLMVTGNLTEAEKTPVPKVTRGPIRFLTPEELAFLLRTVSPDYAPWLVLCAFSGLRSSEIRDWNKPPLTGAMVKLEQGVIDVPAEVSKNRKRKLIPILPVLAAWLKHLDVGDEPLIPDPAYNSETGRLGVLLDEEFKRKEGWPDNCLRHSYCSYRVALTRNIGEVAMEMDNSEKIIKEHYLEAASKDAAEAYFDLSPQNIIGTKP
jgi:integrase